MIGTHFDGTTLFVNASTCTLQYRATNPPIVIDLPLDRSLPAVVVSPSRGVQSAAEWSL